MTLRYVAIVFLTASCVGEFGSENPGFVVDTLPGGAVHAKNGVEGRWSRLGQQGWSLEEEVRIGRRDGDSRYVFADMRNVIPRNDSTIWILDSQGQVLRQYDKSGVFLREIGGPGEGPGEFRFNPCAFAGPDEEIWVESGRQWQRFNSEGELVGTQPVTRSLGCGIRAWRGEEFAAAFSSFNPSTQEVSGALILHDRSANGEVAARDTVEMPTVPEVPRVEWRDNGRVRRSMLVPLYHSPRYTLQQSGVFFVTDGGGGYRFRRQSLEGDTMLVVERNFEPVPVPDSVREAEIDKLVSGELGYPDDFNASDVPSVYPPFGRIVEAQGGMIWLQRTVQGGRTAFDVFSEQGEFLGSVDLPADLEPFQVHVITDDHVIGTTRDELDVSYAVRLRIVK